MLVLMFLRMKALCLGGPQTRNIMVLFAPVAALLLAFEMPVLLSYSLLLLQLVLRIDLEFGT